MSADYEGAGIFGTPGLNYRTQSPRRGRWTRPLLFVLLAVGVMALCSSCAPNYYRSRQFNDLHNTPTTWRLGK